MKGLRRLLRKLQTPRGLCVAVMLAGVLFGAGLVVWSAPAESGLLGVAMGLPLLGAVVGTKPAHELKADKFAAIKRQRAMLDKADAEKRVLTPTENVEYRDLDAKIETLDGQIVAAEESLERRRKNADRELDMMRGDRKAYHSRPDGLADVDPDKEFRNSGEMLWALARDAKDHVSDPRLDTLREKREQTMGTGATGGYAMPEQFHATLRKVQADAAAVRPRATVIPAGDPPDAKITLPALDQTAAQNVYGGVTVVHTGEGVTMTETTARLREVSLEPKEMTAYIVVTDKLLANWEAAGAVVTGLLASAMAGQEDYDCLRGDGVNKALGMLNSAAAIVHSRAGANAISFNDTIDMMARILMRGGSYVWLASQTTIPQLGRMVDAGNHSVWIGSSQAGLQGAAGPLPSTLHGIPIVFSDRLPALGTKGDLSLVNLSYYLVKDGSGPRVGVSEHVFWTANKTCFKIVWNVDGHPWLTEPLPLEGSATSTVSPFVVLE